MNPVRRIYFSVFAWFLLATLLSGCGLKRLQAFKEHHNNADYQWIVQQQISCKPSDEGCNQEHLIKGDACFRLAKAAAASNDDATAMTHYKCAAEHLEAGIQQTRSWQLDSFNLNRSQTYTNLCESLRQWRDLEKDNDVAENVAQQLFQASQRFLQEESNDLAAIYFFNNAKFDQLSDEVFSSSPDKDKLCKQLNEILASLNGAMSRATGGLYQENYERLQSDVAGTQSALGCQ